MRSPFNLTRPMLVAFMALTVGACAHTGGEANPDPLEPYNRTMFKFNDKVDRGVLKPVARGYQKVVPAPVRKSVGNFFLNLGEPTTIVNDVLQGKLTQAANDTMRFVINSTFGVLGLFDLATPMGMERHDEDFGQTFQVWGAPRGPYLVLPLLGPSTTTDGVGIIPAVLYTDPKTVIADGNEVYVLTGTNVIDSRARLLGASRVVEQQLDPYVFFRESYLQKREQLVHDGNPPLDKDWE